jgi:hypothetical protein
MGRLFVPEPTMFYPEFDDGNPRIRETCEAGKCFECKQKDTDGRLVRKDGPLSAPQRAACVQLARSGYRNDPKDLEHAIATHHWAHTWLGQNLHHGTVNVEDVVKKARAKAKAKADG